MLLGRIANSKLFFFLISEIKAPTPQSLKSISLNILASNIQDRSVFEISKTIYPQIFDEAIPLQFSGLNRIFFSQELSKDEIDLSSMNLKRIPIVLACKMQKIKKLDLSGNSNIEFYEEWFSHFHTNLKELSISNCNIKASDLEVINNLSALERLNISVNDALNIDSAHFISILKRLKHLDMSYCDLDAKALEFILTNATKLESLNFCGNHLNRFFETIQIPDHCKNNLKILNLSDCNLRTKDLKILFIFNNLESLNLSKNDFSEINIEIVQKRFPFCTNKAKNNHQIQNKKTKYKEKSSKIKRSHEMKSNSKSFEKKNFQGSSSFFSSWEPKHLKSINLSNCQINSEAFIAKIFDIKNLEALNLSQNMLNFNFNEIANGKAKETLKTLEISGCFITSATNLYHLTNFHQLETLDISYNMFSNAPIGFELGCSKKSLKKLNINWCHLGYNELRAVSECLNLEDLDVSNNGFGNIPENFNLGASKDSLKKLNIKCTYLCYNGLKVITECPNLEYLDVSCNGFSGMTNKFSLGVSARSLKKIKAYQCGMNQHGLKAFTNCSKLEELDISFNYFEELPEDFTLGCSKNSLKELEIHSCNLNCSGLKAIIDCPNLKKLLASRNKFENIQDVFPLSKITNSLTNIDVRNCNINHSGLKALTECLKLEKLDVSFNLFMNIPNNFEFGNSKYSLLDLKISHSYLNYNGLKAISECKMLKSLDISGNGISASDIVQSNILDKEFKHF